MKAPDNILSVREPLEEVRIASIHAQRPDSNSSLRYQFLQSKYTFRYLNMDDSYQRNVVRSKLTRNIAATFDPVHDELVGALRDFIPTIDQGMSHMV
jgi:hypothetical protein